MHSSWKVGSLTSAMTSCVMWAAAASVLVLLPRLAPASPGPYTITRIAPLQSGGQTAALGISPNGSVVGYTSDANQNEQAIEWAGGVTTGLGRIGGGSGTRSKAFAINGGVVVGNSEYNGYGTKVVLWDKDGLHDLGHDGDQSSATATDVNIDGLVVGNYGNGSPAFTCDSGTLTIINAPASWYKPAFFGVNDHGVAVGSLQTYLSTSYAAMWSPLDGWTVLSGPTAHSWANDINNLGVVVGHDSTTGNGAFSWSAADGVVFLPRLAGGDRATALAINDDGLIVGEGTSAQYTDEAVLWDDGQAFQLSSLVTDLTGWTRLQTAQDINNRGQIVGWGIYNQQTMGFILTPVPVPEPATASVLAAGALVLLRRRR